MNYKTFWTQFPLGSHLCREPMPAMSEMKRDMEILKSKGFNLIKLQENWMLDEPKEGDYRFERYHELIEHAGKLEMGIYLGLTCEQAPNWLWEKHPGCRMETKDGRLMTFQAQSTLPADGKPGPCYDDPGAMADQLRFITKLVTELGAHENIVVWNTWQEIAYWSEMLFADQVCYCPQTIAFYHRWLESIYGSIDALNEHWNVRYDSFKSIVPDRGVRKQAIPHQIYYRYFMDNVQIANVLVRRCQAIKAADLHDRPVFAHKGSPEFGSGMDWTYARTQDFLGTSNYPAWGSGSDWDDFKQAKRLPKHEALQSEMWGLACSMDFIRSAAKEGAPVWAAEYQGGPISTDYHIGRVPTAEDMRRWMLTTMSAGATAMAFWITRAEIMAPETNGFALLDSEGETTERLEEAARVGRAMKEYPDLFAENNRPQAEVAILVNEWNYQLLRCLNFAPDAYTYDMRGWYISLWSKGISCDFIEASQLDEARIQNYKSIIAPFSLSMSDCVATALLKYVEKGGNLILEGGCGRLSETAYAVRGQMNKVIRDVLDVKVLRHALVREPSEDDRWSQPERTWGEYYDAGFLRGSGELDRSNLRASIFVETYEASEEDVLFRWEGKPAGISKKVGDGTIRLIGTAVGPSATAYVDDESTSTAKQLLALCEVHPLHEGKLLIQKRIGSNREAWFVTNPHKETVTEKIALPKGAKVCDLLGGALETNGNEVTLTVKSLDVYVLVVS